MLVLSRMKDQVIEIGDAVRVMVVEIRGDRVRLGIEAPSGVEIHRHEVPEAARTKQNADAADGATPEEALDSRDDQRAIVEAVLESENAW